MNHQGCRLLIPLGFACLVAIFSPFQGQGQPAAGFSASQTSGCIPVSVDFQDQSSGNITDYLWDFGNGNTSTKQNPSAIYTQPGTYTVELTVTSNNGQDTETKTGHITVYANPQAAFSVSDEDGCAPKNIDFFDESQEGSGAIQDWTWDLGDGTVANQQNPSHQYASQGTYNVSLVVTDVNGCTDDVTKPSLIDVTEKPEADFDVDDSIACAPPLQVAFSEQAQSSAGGLTYEWDFGDGNTASQANPSHSYQSNGTYDVSLKVTDANGCSDSITKTDHIIVDQEQADFTVSDNSGCLPHEVTFSNLSSPNIPGSTYEWDFGDGNSSQDKNPKHAYQQAGTYTVKLTVKHQNCQDSLVKQDVIEVYPKPNIDFSADENTACETPHEVNFSTSGNKAVIQNWHWDFDDGNTSNISDPSHTFTSKGNYSISLAVTDTAGCQSIIDKTNFVQVRPPQADFNADETGGCIPLDVNFTNLSQSADSVIDYQWDFDDGNVASTENPQHTFNQVGEFDVKLAITTAKGCVDSFEGEIVAGEQTNPDFSADKRVGCLEEMTDVQFTNLTNDAPPLADSFNWRFGDGGTSDKENPVHEYESSTNNDSEDLLDVELISFQNKCPDTIRKEGYIVIEPPWANFTYSTVPCNEDSVIFQNQSHGYDSVHWDFGDGATSSKENPVHKYNSAQFYEVTLTVWNDSTSCKDEMTKQINVPAPFEANFSVDDPNGCTPHKVTFTGHANDSANLQWDFGNGDSSQNIQEKVVYTQPDTYAVKFTAVSKSNGCTKTVENQNAIIVNGAKVDVTADPVKGCTPLEVTATGDVESSSKVTDSRWEYGNGDKAYFDGTPVTYTYESPPDDQEKGYDLSLIVQDDAGCYDTGQVNVQPLSPQPEIVSTKTPFCDSMVYTFGPEDDDNIGLEPIEHHWNFTPGSSYTRKIVDRSFSDDEAVQITLTMEDAEGCKQTDTLNFDFNARELSAGFIADNTHGDCPPLDVSFHDVSQSGYAPISDWHWEFGDGSQSQNPDPQKLYLLPGQYDVKLTVEDTLGCQDSYTGPDFIVLDGPTGDYSLSPLTGCSPLDVTLEAETKGASRVQWDLGDGNVEEGETLSHTYTRSTQYIPLLILSDTTGCTYALPPKDTINVKPVPVAGFVAEGLCFNSPTRFMDTSRTPNASLEGHYWQFEPNETSRADSPAHTFDTPGFYNVTHAVKNGFGCWDTTTQKVDIGGLEVAFDVADTTACQASPLQFFDKTAADTAIASRQWRFGDGDSAFVENPVKTYGDTGFFDVTLAVTDVEGCSDTLRKDSYVGVGDTAPPKVPQIYRATVIESDRVSLVFGQYKDFDFRRYQVYRKRAGQSSYQLIDQVQNLRDTNFIDYAADPLNHSYCYKIQVISYCNRQSDLDSSRAHCTIELTATSDTNRAVLHWNPYQGWDSVSHYLVRRERLNKQGQFSVIDTVPGTQTSAIDSGIACYKRHRYKVKAIEAGGNREFSNSDSSGARPYYIPDVPSNKVRRATVKDNQHVLVEWTDPPGTSVEHYRLERSAQGTNYQALDYQIPPGQQAFIDQNVKVQEENYQYKVQVQDTCGDLGDYSNIGRSILLKTHVDDDYRPVLNWTPYLKWDEGIERYDIELKQEDGSFEVIDQVDATKLTYVDQQTDLNSLPAYVYRVTAHEKGRADTATFSVSNESEVEGVSSLHVSNAFTPNGDGINDEFLPKGMYIGEFHMEIYSRWGEFLYETDDMSEGWDGTYKGDVCQMDAYIYIIEAIGIDGALHHKKGNVTLLK